jgi:hypothetical protein
MTATTDTPRTDACTHCGGKWEKSIQLFACESTTEWRTDLCLEREKSKKLEARVERLREQLTKAIGIAEWYMDNLIDSPRKVALDEIKLTLNPDNK